MCLPFSFFIRRRMFMLYMQFMYVIYVGRLMWFKIENRN